MAVADTTVKYFNSTMSGFSNIGNTAGSLITVLDAALQSGAGTITPLNSLVVSNNVATVTYNGGHGFTMLGNYGGPVITIAGSTVTGADANALNRQWKIASVPSTTQFTFVTSGIADQTATGTISATRSPAGWTKVYSDTNKAAYRTDSLTGNRHYLYIDDTYTTYCRVRLYETMSDINTGTGPTPTDTQLSGGGYIYKSGSSARSWSLFVDTGTIYFFADNSGNSSFSGGFVFGDLIKFAPVDASCVCLFCSTTSSGALNFYALGNTTGSWMPRSYTGLGTAITVQRNAHGNQDYLGYSGTALFPSAVDGKAHFSEVDVWEGTAVVRGKMPGVYSTLHGYASIPNYTVIDGSGVLAGRTFITQTTVGNYMVAFDITGPWR